MTLGFEVTVNEWSMYMNVAYRFLETYGRHVDEQTVFPFVDSWSHHATSGDQQRRLTFPDAPVNTSQVLLVEGDFTTVFNIEKSTVEYDVIVTYFFIDTARNLISYFETIKRLLRPGGFWINLGPLLYGTAPFVQLSLEEILVVIEQGMGFKLIDTQSDLCGQPTFPGKAVRGMEAVYGFDDRALTKNAYQVQFWVAQRP
jgi:carnosine N-methyltransferase